MRLVLKITRVTVMSPIGTFPAESYSRRIACTNKNRNKSMTKIRAVKAASKKHKTDSLCLISTRNISWRTIMPSIVKRSLRPSRTTTFSNSPKSPVNSTVATVPFSRKIHHWSSLKNCHAILPKKEKSINSHAKSLTPLHFKMTTT